MHALLFNLVSFWFCCLGRPIVPPPSYPPPPVPYHPHPNSVSALSKGPSPIPPPIPKKPAPSCPVPTPCSLPPSFPSPQMPPNLGPKPGLRSPRGPMAGPLLPSLDSLKKHIGTRTVSTMPPSEGRDWKPSPAVHVQHPATLPICRDLEKKVVLDGHPKHPPPFAPPGRPPAPFLPNHSHIHKSPMVPSPSAKPQCQTPSPSATSPNLSLVKPKLPPPKPPLPGQGNPTTRGPSLQ